MFESRSVREIGAYADSLAAPYNHQYSIFTGGHSSVTRLIYLVVPLSLRADDRNDDDDDNDI